MKNISLAQIILFIVILLLLFGNFRSFPKKVNSFIKSIFYNLKNTFK